MNKKALLSILHECTFFDHDNIEVHSIYGSNNVEKCFLIKNTKSLEQYKIRFATEAFPETVKCEYKAIQYLKQQNIQWIPKIYFSETECGNNILIYEYFSGESIDKIRNLLTAKELYIIREKLSIVVDQIHSLFGPGYGDFNDNFFFTWQEYFRIKLSKHVNNAHNIGLLNSNDCQTIETVFQKNLDYYKDVKPSFLHFDIKPTNIIFNRRDRETTLIDFELCRFGDRTFDLSRIITNYNKPDKLYDTLLIPLGKSFPVLNYPEFLKTQVFQLYHIYNLLAYYTTSYLKHGVIRRDLAQLTREILMKFR